MVDVVKMLDRVLEVLPNSNVEQLYIFMLVAKDEGHDLTEYTQRSGMKLSTVSRYLQNLSVRLRNGEDSFGLLVREPHPVDLRRHVYYLTPKGKRTMRRFLEPIGQNTEEGDA